MIPCARAISKHITCSMPRGACTNQTARAESSLHSTSLPTLNCSTDLPQCYRPSSIPSPPSQHPVRCPAITTASMTTRAANFPFVCGLHATKIFRNRTARANFKKQNNSMHTQQRNKPFSLQAACQPSKHS